MFANLNHKFLWIIYVFLPCQKRSNIIKKLFGFHELFEYIIYVENLLLYLSV